MLTPVVETPDLPRMKKTPHRADKFILQHYQKHKEPANVRCQLENSPGNVHQMEELDVHNAYFQAAVPMERSDTSTDEEPSDDELDSDDIVAYDTETSRYTTVSDRVRRERQDYRRVRKREIRTRRARTKSHLTLPLFRDSKKEDAIMYVDWHQQVQALIDCGTLAKREYMTW